MISHIADIVEWRLSLDTKARALSMSKSDGTMPCLLNIFFMINPFRKFQTLLVESKRILKQDGFNSSFPPYLWQNFRQALDKSGAVIIQLVDSPFAARARRI